MAFSFQWKMVVWWLYFLNLLSDLFGQKMLLKHLRDCCDKGLNQKPCFMVEMEGYFMNKLKRLCKAEMMGTLPLTIKSWFTDACLVWSLRLYIWKFSIHVLYQYAQTNSYYLLPSVSVLFNRGKARQTLVECWKLCI